MQTSENTNFQLPDLKNSMGENLGIEFQSIQSGLVEATMPVDHRTCQPFGILNGGASLALAEIMAGHGFGAPFWPDPMACGRQSRASHGSMMTGGAIVKGTPRPIQRRATPHRWEGENTSPRGKPHSPARVVNLIVKKRQ